MLSSFSQKGEKFDIECGKPQLFASFGQGYAVTFNIKKQKISDHAGPYQCQLLSYYLLLYYLIKLLMRECLLLNTI